MSFGQNDKYDCITRYKSGDMSPIMCVTVANDTLYAGAAHGEIYSWNIKFGSETPNRTIQWKDTPIRCIHVQNGIIHFGSQNQVIYMDEQSESVVAVGERPGKQSLVADFYYKAGLIYACYTDGCVRVWKDGEWKGSYRGHSATVLCLTIVGREMFTGSKDQTIMTWNLKQAKPHVIWRGKFEHNGPVRSLVVHRGTIFFADGARILAQNIATGQRVFKMEGHEGAVKKIVFNKLNEMLYSVGEDRTIRVWDANKGCCMTTMTGHGGAINSLFIDARGFLFSGSSDQTVREWADDELQDNAMMSAQTAASRVSTFAQPTDGFPSMSRDSTIHDVVNVVNEPPKPRKAAPKRRGTATSAASQPVRMSAATRGGARQTDYGSVSQITNDAAPPRRAAPVRKSVASTPNNDSFGGGGLDLDALEPLDDFGETNNASAGAGAGNNDFGDDDEWADIDGMLDFDGV